MVNFFESGRPRKAVEFRLLWHCEEVVFDFFRTYNKVIQMMDATFVNAALLQRILRATAHLRLRIQMSQTKQREE